MGEHLILKPNLERFQGNANLSYALTIGHVTFKTIEVQRLCYDSNQQFSQSLAIGKFWGGWGFSSDQRGFLDNGDRRIILFTNNLSTTDLLSIEVRHTTDLQLTIQFWLWNMHFSYEFQWYTSDWLLSSVERWLYWLVMWTGPHWMVQSVFQFWITKKSGRL